MRLRLSWKLALTYLALIILSMAVFGYFTMQFFQESYLENKEATLFSHANIVATGSAPYLRSENNSPKLHALAREYAERVGSRFLVLDASGKVVADSANDFVGRQLMHEEIQSALAGENAAEPHYEADYGWVLYLAAPVYSGKQVIGAVFMATDINPLVSELDEIRKKLYGFSITTGAIVFVISLFFGTFITRPLKRLIFAARKITAGNYGVQVKDIKRNDEIGELNKVFNEMSAKIKAEDTIRKQFVANASHELKSPIAALKALVESCPENGQVSEEERLGLLKNIKLEVDRMGKLVEDLLVLSRLEGNRQQLNLEETSVGELTEAVKKTIIPLARNKDITLETVHDGDVYWKMDGEKIFRALLNLIDNAIKYSPDSGKVTLGFRVNEDKLFFFISDTGEGIPQDELSNIFDRFYRVDKARSRKTGGWGLGLAIVKEIVELHGGLVRVESEPGRTVFSIELPHN